MGLLDDGQAALIRRMKAAYGRTVNYTRGAVANQVVAWLGRTLFARSASEPGGATASWGDRDYLVAVADLAAAGVSGGPQLGDRVTETIAGAAVTFEVMTPDTQEPAVRYSDATRTVWRIHTKRVG